MRKTTIMSSVILLFIASCTMAQKSNLEIASNSSIALEYPNYEMCELQLKNNTGAGLEVRVENKETGEFVSGFGLGSLATVEVVVAQGNKILFTNSSNKMGKLSVKMLNSNAKLKVARSDKRISFTLLNTSNESIPLIIPDVMNPNLSPNSSSGVDLKMGQELLFKNGFKKYVLLTVDDSITNGQEVDVYEILKQRKKELGLK